MSKRTVDFITPFVAAWTLWRRDRALLLPLAGLFVFVPQLAVLLLVPDMPRMAAGEGGEEAMRAWSLLFADWFASHGALFLGSMLLAQFATLAVAALYVDRERPTAQLALRRGAMLLPRYLLASLLVALPFGALMALAPLPATVLLLMLPMLYVFARTLLVGPVLIAERPLSAVGAIKRSWQLTAGNGASLMAIFAATSLVGRAVASVLLGLVAVVGANPVAVAILAAAAALATAAAALALVLASVVIYGRLASKGT